MILLEQKGRNSVQRLPKRSIHFYYIGISRLTSNSMDGGARIFIETAKRWINNGHIVNLLTTREHREVCLKYGLLKANYHLIPCEKHVNNIYIIYLLRMLRACFWSFFVMLPENENAVILSASDFWPDSIPAWILKMRSQHSKWVAPFYLFASNPFSKRTPYKGARWLRGFLYYVSQVPIYGLVKRYADMVWVTSEPDRWKFMSDRLPPEKVIAVKGGVDINSHVYVPEPRKKIFDAVFIGRFHPQKGVLELVDIWRFVCEKRKNALLAIIGVGELESELKTKIIRQGLTNKISLLGFKDGYEKLSIFKSSKVVVHPAVYDSGGMAACEALVCGLPGVSFDLPALRSYYPKGMLKTPCYDLKAFAENIIKLLDDKSLYEKTAKDALDWAKEWDWDKRADDLLEKVQRVYE